MDPAIWGPHLWFFLHSMSFAYAKDKDHPTELEKRQMYQFLESLKYVLPCICKNNYSAYFDKYPPKLNSRKELFRWLVDLHNHVNMEHNKELSINSSKTPRHWKRKYTYKEVEKMYIDRYTK